jgi:hypothetical protein
VRQGALGSATACAAITSAVGSQTSKAVQSRQGKGITARGLEQMAATKKQARIAGLLYTLVAITAPIGLVYVPNKLIVTGNATATADHIRVSGSLLHAGIASELFHQTIEVFLILVLYGLFKAVHQPLARQMAVLGFMPIPIVFLNVLNEVAAQILTSGPSFLAVFDQPRLDALALFFMRLHGQGLLIAGIFWGLWLFPLGLLILRSGFIPKVVGLLAMIAGCGYVLESLMALVLPQYASGVENFASVLELGEPPLILWLLIWGAKTPVSGPGVAPQAN